MHCIAFSQLPLLSVHLSAGVHHIPTNHLALLHHVVDTLQLTQANGLEWCLDQTARIKVEGLLGVLPVADVAALDRDHADDRFEYRRGDASVGRETDAHDGATGADILGGLLKGLLGDGE